LGLHFFSPAERMPLVEVVKGEITSEFAVQDGLTFVRSIGKVPIVVRDGPSFFATRVFAAYLDEATCMLRVPADRDHGFQAIVITHSRAS